MKCLVKFFRKQSVLCISFICAAASAFIVPPDKEYIGYINSTTLILLFCLMGAVAGFESCGIFRKLSDTLTSGCRNLRALVFVLMNVCFFSSMLVTNDVALITFVPVTVMVFSKLALKKNSPLIWTVVIETAAANLGSMLLPTGNPQNIFLCSEYAITPVNLIKTLGPFGILSYIILSLSILLIPVQEIKSKITEAKKGEEAVSVRTAILCAVVFIVSLLTVSGIINEYICLGVCVLLLAAADIKCFAKIDYSLLLTFVFFFVFSGNIGRIETLQSFLSEAVQGRELVSSVLTSQIISNVPAAVLLSGFTDNAGELLIGTNIGGLGTPIASLASLISYRIYAAEKESSGGKYMLCFLAYNVIFLVLLLAAALVVFC